MISMDLMNRARAVIPGSPIAEMAVDVCMLRGTDPFAYNPTSMVPGMANWQLVVMEFMIFHVALPGMMR
jgi:hypothetical protein